MKMIRRRSFLRNACGVLCFFLAVGLVSCDDSDDLKLGVDGMVLEKGVSTDLDGGYYDIPVSSNGEWTASLPEACDWAMVMNERGNGDGTVKIFIEGNYTGDNRSSHLTISNGDQKYDVAIRQDNTLGGQPVNNDETDCYFINVASSKGLGMGYDLEKYKAKSAVINLKAVEALMKEDEITYYALYSSNRLSEFEAREVNIDSVEQKNDSLGVRLSLTVAYGTFKLGISGGYHGTEDRVTNAKRFRTAANYPTLETALDYSSVIAIYNEAMEEQATDYRKSLLTPGFVRKSKALTDLIDAQTTVENYASNTKLSAALKNLVDTYGPSVTVGSTLGGMFALEFEYDSVYTKEVMSLDSAKIALSINLGLFSLDAGVAAAYSKSASDLLEKSVCSCLIKGGAQEGQSGIYRDFKNQSYTSLNSSVAGWVSTLKTDDNKSVNNAEVIEVQYEPIWVFFEGVASDIVRDYVENRYKGSRFE